jgi:hypothetical protein
LLFIYHESTKRKLKTKDICGCRCYERLQPNSKEFTRLLFAGFVVFFFGFLLGLIIPQRTRSGEDWHPHKAGSCSPCRPTWRAHPFPQCAGYQQHAREFQGWRHLPMGECTFLYAACAQYYIHVSCQSLFRMINNNEQQLKKKCRSNQCKNISLVPSIAGTKR